MKEATHEFDILCNRAVEIFLEKFNHAYASQPNACSILTRIQYARHALRELPRLKELGWKLTDILDDIRIRRLITVAKSPISKRDYWLPNGMSEEDMMTLVVQHRAEFAKRGRPTRHDHEPPHIRARLIELDRNEYRKNWMRKHRKKTKSEGKSND